MPKPLKPGFIENWKITDASGAGVLSDYPERKFVIGQYQGLPIRTSFIVHDGSPSYVETNNTVYLLGEPLKVEPVEKPLTPIQNQAVVVAKQALVECVTKSDLDIGSIGKLILEDSAQATANIVIRALIRSALLVR